MTAAAAALGQADLWLAACLTDRAPSNRGQPQTYGTQGIGGARSSAEKALIDARRQGITLPTLDEFRTGIERGTGHRVCGCVLRGGTLVPRSEVGFAEMNDAGAPQR